LRRRNPATVAAIGYLRKVAGTGATSGPVRMLTDGGLEAGLGTAALARVAAWSAAGDGHLIIARSLRPVPRTSTPVLDAA
jgi:hypothetical protein